MKQGKPQYTEELRMSSAKLAIDSDQPIYKTAENLGVNEITLLAV